MQISMTGTLDNKEKNKIKKRNDIKRNITGWLMIAPPFVGFICFTMIPMLVSLCLSFCNLNTTILEYATWTGLDNYVRLLKSGMFYQSLGNTAYYCVGIFLNMGLSLFLANTLCSHRVVGDKAMRILLFLPQVCSTVAVTVMWT